MERINQKKFILYVIDGLEYGGGERVFLQLANGVDSQYRVAFACAGVGDFSRKLAEQDIALFPVDFRQQLSWQPIKQLVDIIRKESVGLVHTQGARADFYGRLAAKITGRKVISTIAMPVEGFDVGPLKKLFYRLLDFISEQHVKAFLVVSAKLRQTLLRRWRMTPERVVLIYNGVELEKYNPCAGESSLKKELGLALDVPLIGAVGRMVWQKGFRYLIEAVPAILEKNSQTMFVIVGDVPLAKEFRELADSLSVADQIIFTGFREDVAHVIAGLDVIVIPSLLEGFPMVTLEAMAMAKPIVATRIDGTVEQIGDCQEGLLVPPRSSDAIAAAVMKLQDNETMAKNLGHAARRKVEESFSVEKMVVETVNVYEALFTHDVF